MPRCPNCNNNPWGFSSCWMYLKKCRACGIRFCYKCEKAGRKCPKCGSTNIDEQYEKIYGDRN